MDLNMGYNLRTIENEDLEFIRKWRNEQIDILDVILLINMVLYG